MRRLINLLLIIIIIVLPLIIVGCQQQPEPYLPTPEPAPAPTPAPVLTWQKTFGGRQSDIAYSVHQTSDGGYIIAGETKSYGAGDLDIYLVKTDEEGNSISVPEP